MCCSSRSQWQGAERRATASEQLTIPLMRRLNERKDRIDSQIAFLSSLPKVQPFTPAAPQRSSVSRKEWEAWWEEHDRIEGEADHFREDEYALMKRVAKGKTSNMSREDTDLVEVTLSTLEAFSRLEHLLRARRQQLQVLKLRLQCVSPL